MNIQRGLRRIGLVIGMALSLSAALFLGKDYLGGYEGWRNNRITLVNNKAGSITNQINDWVEVKAQPKLSNIIPPPPAGFELIDDNAPLTPTKAQTEQKGVSQQNKPQRIQVDDGQILEFPFDADEREIDQGVNEYLSEKQARATLPDGFEMIDDNESALALKVPLTIKDIRVKYPEYNDLSDQQLADKLHKKYYSDIPINDFYNKIGLKVPSAGGTFSSILPDGTRIDDIPNGTTDEEIRAMYEPMGHKFDMPEAALTKPKLSDTILTKQTSTSFASYLWDTRDKLWLGIQIVLALFFIPYAFFAALAWIVTGFQSERKDAT